MNRLLLFALLLILGNHTSAQVMNSTVLYDGVNRSYVTYVPTTWLTTVNMPLLFVLHGTTQTGQGIADISEFNTIAENEGFIVVYPDGIGGSWNTGIPGASTADDMGLIDTLIVMHEALYGTDQSRVFSCGFSAGGYMSYRLACESPRCFAGVASVSGTMTDLIVNNCSPLFTTPVLHIHGDADFVVAYNGSVIAGIGVDSVMATWNGYNTCPTVPVMTSLPDINTMDNSTVDKYTFEPCAQNLSNVLLKVNGGGHQWPGTNAILGGIGVINRDIDASEEIWNFFSALDCDNVTTVSEEQFIDPSTAWFDPTMNALHFDLSDKMEYRIVNAQGKSVGSGMLAIGEHIVDLHDLSPGVYICSFPSGSEVAYRFVKE